MREPSPSDARPESPDRRLHSGRVAILAIAAIVLVILAVDIMFARRNRDTAREKAAAERAYADPERTTIRWRTTPSGLEQRAVAAPHLPADARDDIARLIRVHLREVLIQRRNVGDYGTPAFAGTPMPGRDVLEDGAGDITVIQDEVPGGGTLTYSTNVAALRRALQDWSAAQQRASGASATSSVHR